MKGKYSYLIFVLGIPPPGERTPPVMDALQKGHIIEIYKWDIPPPGDRLPPVMDAFTPGIFRVNAVTRGTFRLNAVIFEFHA